MNLLRNRSRNIQFEAFHLFKVFVANPNKTSPVLNILLRNREKLVEFLDKFQNDRTDDEQFNEEKAVLIKQINALQPPQPQQQQQQQQQQQAADDTIPNTSQNNNT